MLDLPAAARIDAHHHLWDLDARDQPWIDPVRMATIGRNFDATDLAVAVEGTHVTSTVLVQVLNRTDETDDLLDVAATNALISGVVGWADLSRADLPAEIERLQQRGPLVGIRHQLQAEVAPTQWLERTDVGAGLGQLAALELPFDLMIRPEQFDAAAALVRANADVNFVIDHLGKPSIESGELEPWASGIEQLAREPNVSCKLSGLVTVADHRTWTVDDLRPYVELALSAFGPARLMFGSDWPVCLLAADYRSLVHAVETLIAELSPSEQTNIWADTARRVYAIGSA